MSDDPRVEELARAHHKASHHCALDTPHHWNYAWARSVWDAEVELRERIAQEIEAAHRAAPDCCAYDVAARIARGQA